MKGRGRPEKPDGVPLSLPPWDVGSTGRRPRVCIRTASWGGGEADTVAAASGRACRPPMDGPARGRETGGQTQGLRHRAGRRTDGAWVYPPLEVHGPLAGDRAPFSPASRPFVWASAGLGLKPRAQLSAGVCFRGMWADRNGETGPLRPQGTSTQLRDRVYEAPRWGEGGKTVGHRCGRPPPNSAGRVGAADAAADGTTDTPCLSSRRPVQETTRACKTWAGAAPLSPACLSR